VLALALDPSGLGHAATLTRRPRDPPVLKRRQIVDDIPVNTVRLDEVSVVSVLRICRIAEFFCFLAPFVTKIYVWTLRNFICMFGPDARRHRLWRRANTSRRPSLWRRGLTWQQRLPSPRADLAPTWWRRDLVARCHRSWRRATDAYKNGRAAGREQHISSFQTSSKFAGFKDLSWFTS
jgi:hypothetical protein